MLVIFIAPAARTTISEITDITLQPEMISRLARFWFRCLVFFTCNWFLFTVRLYFLSSFSGNVFGSPLLFSGLSFVCLFFLPKRFGKRVFLLAEGQDGLSWWFFVVIAGTKGVFCTLNKY